jgi:uncharacterized membrane protein
MAACAKCGALVSEDARYCPACGSAAHAPTPENASFAPGRPGLTPNVAALLSYLLWPVACLLFLLLEPYNKNRFVRFHAFQAFFLGLAGGAVGLVLLVVTTLLAAVPLLGWLLDFLLWAAFVAGFFGLVIFLMYKAYNGERYSLPWIGNLAAQQAETPP